MRKFTKEEIKSFEWLSAAYLWPHEVAGLNPRDPKAIRMNRDYAVWVAREKGSPHRGMIPGGENEHYYLAKIVLEEDPDPVFVIPMRLLSGNMIQLHDDIVSHLRAEVGEVVFYELRNNEVVLTGEKFMNDFLYASENQEGVKEEI